MNLLRGIEIVGATSLRVPKEERDPNLYYYDVRHDDDCIGIPSEVSKFVMVNHLGTIITKGELPLTDFGGSCLELTEEEEDIVAAAF